MEDSTRPRVALTVGDPAGIGPEIVRAVLEGGALAGRLRLVVLGPGRLCPGDVARVTRMDEADVEADVLWLPTPTDGDWEPGRAQRSAGAAALAALRAGAELAQAGQVDALVTAPVSKEALHLAGAVVEGQSQLLAEWAGVPTVDMLALAGELRVSLLTRHMPLRDALDAITEDRVHAHLLRLAEGMRGLGFAEPRLALAGLNPHAGEAGILGREELDVLVPALARARRDGVDVAGPESPDTVFERAASGAFDAVLALYHDQAFIPVKLAAPLRGSTVLLGLPYLRVSPAHGTAFDIVGRGVADWKGLEGALLQAGRWAIERRERNASGAEPAHSAARSRA